MSDEEDTESESVSEKDDSEESEKTGGEAAVEAEKKDVPNGEKGEKEEEDEEEEEDDDPLKSLNLGANCISILKNAFTAFDHEKKGVLGTEMIGVILELLGHSLAPSELDDIIREVDADGSGELEFDEFVILASKFLPEDSEEESPEKLNEQLKEAFRFYDKEGNGYITTDDFKVILKELDPDIPEEELQGMINEIDVDDSGTVDFSEFMAALQ